MRGRDAGYRMSARYAALAILVAATLTIAGWVRFDPVSRDFAAEDATLSPDAVPAGLLVTSLKTDGVAARAGLRVGDVIDRVDDDVAPTPATLIRTADDPVALIHVAARGDAGARTLLLRHAEVGYREDPDRRGR